MNEHLLRFYGKKFFAPENDTGVDVDDAAGSDDEGADDAAGSDDEGADDVDPAPKRGETRVQRLANEARRERERAIALETENRLLKERPVERGDSGEAARIRAEKIALMDPVERRVFEQDETIQRLQQGQQQTQFMLADSADKSAYAMKAAKSPIYAKHSEWVENTLAQERKQGRYPTREALLMLKIGYDAVNAKPSKKLAAKKAEANERVNGAKAPAQGARSDVRGKADKEDSLESLRARIQAREASGDM